MQISGLSQDHLKIIIFIFFLKKSKPFLSGKKINDHMFTSLITVLGGKIMLKFTCAHEFYEHQLSQT